ncbi:MAG: SoxR reducing system RseC family protein [Gammaproteobacteria bacterium]|nr:SoxR reducing system RseC family protein [Gammaproteobacteria bacterium]
MAATTAAIQPYNSAMINPQGRILSITGSGPDRRALVDVDSTPVCPRCAEGKGCGAGLFGAGARKRQVEATVPLNANIAIGDKVAVTLAPRNILAAASIVYGWPLIGAAVGAAIAYWASYDDVVAAVSALIGLTAGAMLVRRRLSASQCLRQFTPQILV